MVDASHNSSWDRRRPRTAVCSPRDSHVTLSPFVVHIYGHAVCIVSQPRDLVTGCCGMLSVTDGVGGLYCLSVYKRSLTGTSSVSRSPYSLYNFELCPAPPRSRRRRRRGAGRGAGAGHTAPAWVTHPLWRGSRAPCRTRAQTRKSDGRGSSVRGTAPGPRCVRGAAFRSRARPRLSEPLSRDALFPSSSPP